MRSLGRVTDFERAVEMLHGIIAGVAIDYELNDAEIVAFHQWLSNHHNLLGRHPFDEVHARLDTILADGRIDEQEREELLAWCQGYLDRGSAQMVCITASIRRLHGVLHGVVIDGTLSDQEVVDLNDWLVGYGHLREHWPFDAAMERLEKVLRDGKVEAFEKEELMTFCSQFSERPVEAPQVHDRFGASEPWMRSEAPILHTLDGICEKEPCIEFPGNRFCFTGLARFGKRSKLHALVEGLGGVPKGHVTLDLSYLVIGAQSQPCWVFSTYGRKIEEVMTNRKSGASTQFLREDDFLEAALRD